MARYTTATHTTGYTAHQRQALRRLHASMLRGGYGRRYNHAGLRWYRATAYGHDRPASTRATAQY